MGEPGFHRGDILFLTNYNERDPLKPGDIPVFQIEGRQIPIVHRTMNTHERADGMIHMLTKGDNNQVDDRGLYGRGENWIGKKEVMGRAQAFLPYVGMVTIWMNDYPWLKYLLIGTMGFFVVDGISMLVVDVWKGWRPVDHLMLVHHSFILLCFGCGVFCDLAVWFCATLLVNEGSTPFLHVFWYLNITGQKDSKAFMVNGCFLVLSFFLFRMVFIPFNYYQFVQLDHCSGREGLKGWLFWLMNPFYVFIFLLNLVWFVKLLRGAFKKLLGGKSRGEPVG